MAEQDGALACHMRAGSPPLLLQMMPEPEPESELEPEARPEAQTTGACTINRPCAQQYVGKSQSCMVISGRLIVHAPVCQLFKRQHC